MTWSASGWLPIRPRSASRSPTSRRPAAVGTGGRGSPRPGAALLLSLGFRPDWLSPDRVWRLVATASLAMADAAEEVAGLADHAIRLKWPNDLVIEGLDGGGRTQAGRSAWRDGRIGLGRPARGRRPRHQRGLGAGRLPRGSGRLHDLAARGIRGPSRGSLRTARRLPRSPRGARRSARAAGGSMSPTGPNASSRPAARSGSRDTTAGRSRLRALGVDATSGALVVEDPTAASGERPILVGEVVHVRLATPSAHRERGVTPWPVRH